MAVEKTPAKVDRYKKNMSSSPAVPSHVEIYEISDDDAVVKPHYASQTRLTEPSESGDSRKALKEYRDKWGTARMDFRGGREENGGVGLVYDDLMTLLVDEDHNGWTNGSVLSAAIATIRGLDRDDRSYFIPHHVWAHFKNHPGMARPKYPGNNPSYNRYILVDIEDTHWSPLVYKPGPEATMYFLDSRRKPDLANPDVLALRRVVGGATLSIERSQI